MLLLPLIVFLLGIRVVHHHIGIPPHLLRLVDADEMAYSAGRALVGGGCLRRASEEGGAGGSEHREKAPSRLTESAWHPRGPAPHAGTLVSVLQNHWILPIELKRRNESADLSAGLAVVFVKRQ